MRIRWVHALRGVVVVAVLVSAAVHLYVYVEGFAGIPVIGPLFLATVVGGIVIAAAVGIWPHWIPALLAIGFGLTTVVAYWISVVHGLFGVREVTDGWPEIVAETAEYATVVSGTIVATVLWRHRNSHRSRTPARSHRARDSAGAAEAPPAGDRAMPSRRGTGDTVRQPTPHGRTER